MMHEIRIICYLIGGVPWVSLSAERTTHTFQLVCNR